MAALILPSRWTRQPQYPVEADRSFGCSHLFSLLPVGPTSGIYLRDSAGYANCTWAATGGTAPGYLPVVSNGQQATKFSDSGTGSVNSKFMAVGDSSGSGSPVPGQTFGAFSYVIWCKPGDVASTYLIAGSDSANQLSIRIASTEINITKPSVASLLTSSGAGLTTSSPVFLSYIYDGANAKLYKNKTLVGSGSFSQTFNSSAQYTFFNQNNGELYFCAVFPFAIPDALVFDLVDCPWQAFRPLNRRIYFGVAAAADNLLGQAVL